MHRGLMHRRSGALDNWQDMSRSCLGEGKEARAATKPARGIAPSHVLLPNTQKRDTAMEQKLRGQTVVLYKRSLVCQAIE
jgi:hypothetical protein